MKKIGFIIAFLCLSFTILAQEQFTGALLWKISGKDIRRPSYIVGTHHAVPLSFVDSIPGLTHVLKQIKQVVGEVDLSDKEAIQSTTLKYLLMPKGYSYKLLLSEEEYMLLDKTLTELAGMGLDQLQTFHPASINALILQLCCREIFPEFQTPTFEPIDQYVQTLAHKQKKNIIGLETLEEQLELLYNNEPIELQVKELMCLIKYPNEAISLLKKITEFYYRKQLNEIFEIFESSMEKSGLNNGDCASSPYTIDKWNKDRNDKWLTILPEIMKKKSSLIAVGAMHIAGKDGLLYQLHKMGYTVEPVIK